MSEIAVVIPARNAAAYLPEALGSVLAQSPEPTEVVVVDDGSIDATATVASGFGEPVAVVSQPAAGLATACNLGVASTSAPLVALLDADDLWADGKLAAQHAALEADSSVDLVFGHAAEFVSPELSAQERAKLRPRAPQPFRAKGTMLARRDAIARVGGFDEALVIGDFVDWCARADDAGLRSLMLDRVVLHRRLHSANHGRLHTENASDFVRIARRALERRRGGTA